MARRGHNEGTIVQRADGRWAAAVMLGWQDGKRARKWLYGKTRAEVAGKLTRVLRDRQQGLAPADERTAVTEWVTRHVDDLAARAAVKHATLVRYRGILERYLGPALGHFRLAQLQPTHVRDYQSGLLKLGLSASSIVLHRAVLSGALDEAVRFNMIPRNVVRLVKPPKADADAKGRALSAEHARALLARWNTDPLGAYYLVLLTAGLRRGEGLGLRWTDLGLPGQNGRTPVVHVRRQLQSQDGQQQLVPLKSKRSLRTVPLPNVTVDALLERRRAQHAEFERIGRPWRSSEFVFTTSEGEPTNPNLVTRAFQAHLRAAELPPYRLHDLRHTYGSLLMSQGVPLKTIADLMGHASIEVTADVYLHSVEDQVLDTANAVERALGAAPAGTICTACGRPF